MALRTTSLAQMTPSAPAGSSSSPSVALPYLEATHKIISTLEREVRARALPGTADEAAATALRMRATEISAQMSRLEMEARTAGLEQMLGGPSAKHRNSERIQQSSNVGAATAAREAREERATLKAQLEKAEKDIKAYKSRLRSSETLHKELELLATKVMDLEKRLITAEGDAATSQAELEMVRKRAVVAEATCDALRGELKVGISSKEGQKQRELELVRQVSAMQETVGVAQLERATSERRAEVCEAELVETLAKMFTLERQVSGGAGVLSEADFLRVDECLHLALEKAGAAAAPEAIRESAAWESTKGWLSGHMDLGEVVAEALMKTLRTRHDPHGRPYSRSIERCFLLALGQRGDASLLRAMLADAALVDRLSERIWSGVMELLNADVNAHRASEAETLAALAQTSAAPQVPLAPREQQQQQHGVRRSLALGSR